MLLVTRTRALVASNPLGPITWSAVDINVNLIDHYAYATLTEDMSRHMGVHSSQNIV